MADQSITQLPVTNSLSGNEVTVVVQNGVTKQVNVALLASTVAPGKLVDYVYFSGSNLVFVYTDGTQESVGPIPGYVAAQIDANGHLILTNSDGGTTDAGSVFASLSQSFLTVTNEPDLPNSQRLAAGAGISLSSTGPQGALTVSMSGAPGSLATAGHGMIAKNTDNSVIARTITSGSTGISITNGDGVAGNPTVGLAGKLADIEALNTNGVLAVNGSDVVARNIVGTTSQIDVSFGDGTGNPTISINDNPILPGTGSVTLPKGNTSQRPGALSGQLRFNTETDTFEGQNSSGVWQPIALGSGLTSITAGTGLSGGTITSTGTIAIANTGVSAATYGSASTVPTIAVNAQGQITNATNTSIAIASSAITDKGLPNGVASLDAGGTVPLSQIPASIQGGVSYQGTWNASTNTPTLTSSVGSKGYYYVVSVAGNTNLNGITDWQIGDWAIFNGSVWEKIDNTDAVTSVNGYTGTVVLTQPDIAGTANAPTNTNITSMTGVTGGISSPDFVQFDTTVTPVEAVAKLQWDDGNGTLQFGLKGGSVNLQVGQELVARCYNDSGTTLTDGQIVYISGAQGNRIAVKLAKADSETTSAGTLGMVTETIAAGAEGFITLMGTVNKLNTTGLTAGHLLYLSATTAGAYTETPPAAPNHKVTIGYVERISSTVGSIYVKVDNGYELNELHNVEITSPTGGNLLVYDQTGGYWKNANLTDGTGISITEGTGGTVTITNSAPDQTVVLTAGTGISTSGTYPSFTITNTAPDQVVSLTGAGTTTVSGTYPNFTITSNDQYAGTVTSVSGTGSVSGITLSGTVTSSGNLTLGGALDLSAPPAIGGTTPNTITGTTITATQYVGISGGTF